MAVSLRWNALPSALLISFMLSACGGHNYEEAKASDPRTPDQLAAEPGAPALSGNIATDAFNWYNFRRQQIGLPLLERKTTLNSAAQSHADYMKTINNAQHEETAGQAGFTGVGSQERMVAAGYVLNGGITGEVLSAINKSSGFYHADALVMAIGHRFLIFDPSFNDAGSGFATGSNGMVYVNTNLASSGGFGPGLSGAGNIAMYPFSGQQQVQPNFFSDTEDPDPVAGANEVGFPISVHANREVELELTTFEVKPRGGEILAATLVTHGVSAMAIIPTLPLKSNTTYDVKFVGTAVVPSTIEGQSSVDYLINRTWSFTTR